MQISEIGKRKFREYSFIIITAYTIADRVGEILGL